jgi:hypothetical protein
MRKFWAPYAAVIAGAVAGFLASLAVHPQSDWQAALCVYAGAFAGTLAFAVALVWDARRPL